VQCIERFSYYGGAGDSSNSNLFVQAAEQIDIDVGVEIVDDHLDDNRKLTVNDFVDSSVRVDVVELLDNIEEEHNEITFMICKETAGA
jgi:hypothetical protein